MRIGYWNHRQKCGGKLYMFGGDKQQNTTSTATNTDARAVTTDSYNTSNYDLSNRSTNLTSNAWTDASTSNSNNTTTTSADFSNRSVNTSTTNSTTNADFSNRSITSNAWADSSNSNNTSTTNADFSNRSVSSVDSHDLTTTNNAWTDARATTTNTDNRDQSVNYITTNSLDGGAVNGALNFAGKAMTGALDQVQSALGFAAATVAGDQANVVHAYDYAGGLFDSATNAADKSNSRAYDAFDRAAQIEASALAMTGASAKTALDQVQNAYADAKGTTQAQQKIMLAVLAVAGVAVLARAKG